MAATQVGTTGTKNDGTGTTHTLSYAMHASANFCRVSVTGYNGTTISSVTYNGVALSLIGSELTNADGRLLSEFGLVSPATGTNNLVVTFSASVSGALIAISGYTGVDTTSPTSGFQSFTTSGAGDTSPTNLPAVTSATDDLVVGTVVTSFDDTMTADGAQTEEANFNDELFGSGRMATSHKAGASSVSLSWTFTGTLDYCVLGYSIKAAAGGGGGRVTKNRPCPCCGALGMHLGMNCC